MSLDTMYRKCPKCGTELSANQKGVMYEVYCPKCGKHSPAYFSLRDAFVGYFDIYGPTGVLKSFF